ncbi:regulatory protein RecX [Paraburkholderia sp. UCT31]|uniref:regulatory protein RecX n=1 Tax=Paraburkholderia sp. UCT31 TaxID=2615209 RepID=UPI0016552A4C|nr:regulatory protein RecX [Paraburkholderia sp. UCT31]MBC8737404.1 regulatory protein RecX [Paraburkholderia sp. UCT31]
MSAFASARKTKAGDPDSSGVRAKRTPRRNGPKRNEDGTLVPPKQSAKSYLVWLLARHEYSAADLRAKLIRRGYPAEDADAALSFAQEHRFQSDERYARMKSQSAAGRHGNYRLKQTLKAKGIEAGVIEAQLEDIEPEADRAVRVAARFKGKELTRELRQKAHRFLMYRGFGSDSIKIAMASLGARSIDEDATFDE